MATKHIQFTVNSQVARKEYKAGTDDHFESQLADDLVSGGYALYFTAPAQASEPNEGLAGAVDYDGRLVELASMKVDQLKPLAKELGIEGADQMKKDVLIEAIADVEFEDEDEGGEGQ
jgi:hypothetical protein